MALMRLFQDTKKQQEGSLVWIQYQRFSRRSEGVRASRQVLELADAVFT